jgi:hypothetical protein
VSSFAKNIILNLKPFFSVVMFLVLPALVITTPFIIEIYNRLTSILGYNLGPVVNVLILVLFFGIKLLLMIRKAENSHVQYKQLFDYVAKHYLSGILYFFILLLSVGLVYCCGYDGGCLYDFDYNGVYN